MDCARGIEEGYTRDIAILSRVGKPVACVITDIQERQGKPHLILSRRLAQEACLQSILREKRAGDILPATVTHLEPFGAFVDLGCGLSSMVGIEQISVSRIPHSGLRFSQGQRIHVLINHLDEALGRIYLSHKELLGTWAENCSQFEVGMTVPGFVRGQKDYGLFVELSPNLSGLAEPYPDLLEGDRVSVYIKAMTASSMKVKLLIIDKLPPLTSPAPLHYFLSHGHIDSWDYAPDGCFKIGPKTVF